MLSAKPHIANFSVQTEVLLASVSTNLYCIGLLEGAIRCGKEE
jgi:hypothetical protein